MHQRREVLGAAAQKVIASNQGATERMFRAFGGAFKMNQYLLSVMKGQKNSFTALLITYLLWPWSFVYGIGCFLSSEFLSA